MTLFVLTITISLFMSFLCSILEACLLSLSLSDIARISEKKPHIAKIWENFKTNIHKPIAVILIVNTLAHTIGASVSGSLFTELFAAKWILIFSLVYSLVMIQWTEILPKTWGVQYNQKIAVLLGIPLNFIVKLFAPVVFLTHIINRPFEGKKKSKDINDINDDISVLVQFAAINKTISTEQEKILSKTMNLPKMQLKDIMVEKNEIKFLSTDMSLNDALIEAHMHHHTRLPLALHGNLDNIIGYVNFKDIVSVIRINPLNPTLEGIKREIMFVNQDDNLSHIFNKLIKGSQHIGIIKNNENKVTGLITLEDLIEAIVGEINDEYDILPKHFYQILDNRFIAGGGIELTVLNEKLSSAFPSLKKTVNDYLIEQTGKLPAIKSTLTFCGCNIYIKKIVRSQINEVIIDKLIK